MDNFSLLFQNKWSVALLIVSVILVALAIVSPKVRTISRRQEEERKRLNPPQKDGSLKAQLFGGASGAAIGAFIAYGLSGFSVQNSILGIGALVGYVIGEIVGVALSQTLNNQP